MSNSKISALTSATTPLAGTETLPVVQGSATKQVSVANLTAGRAVSALSFTGTSDSSFNGVTVGRGSGGSGNTILGNGALSTTTGNLSVAAGYQAGARVSSGNSNVLIGYRAGDSTGTYAGCTFIGDRIGLSNASSDNCGVGQGALESVSSGQYNSAFGASYYGVTSGPLGALTTGSFNTACGNQAGLNLTTGSNCGFFGYNAQPSANNASNEYNYGNSSVTSHRFYGNITLLTASKGVTTGSAINLGLGTNGNTTQANIDTAGNLLIGTTTTPSGALVNGMIGQKGSVWDANHFGGFSSGTAVKVSRAMSIGGMAMVTGYSATGGYNAIVMYQSGVTPTVVSVANTLGSVVVFTVVGGALYITNTGTAATLFLEANVMTLSY